MVVRFFFLGTKVTPFGVISVVANKDLAGIQVDVHHLYAKGVLDVRTDAMYACRLAATGVHTGCIFFYLQQTYAVFVYSYHINRGSTLRGNEDPVALPHKMFGADRLAHVAVNMTRKSH